MTKAEFVDQVADRSGIGKGEAGKVVDAVLDTIKEVLSRGGEINFTGFGKFAVADRGARQGVNPQTGASAASCSCSTRIRQLFGPVSRRPGRAKARRRASTRPGPWPSTAGR